MKNISLNDLLSDKKFRTMDVYELSNVINNSLLYLDYKKLDGADSDAKAINLKEKWANEN